jgi:hypothetical protein
VTVLAKLRNVVAGLSDGTPSGSWIESQADSAIVVSGTARRNSNAALLQIAPGKSSSASTFAAVIVCKRTLGRDGSTGLGGRAPRESGLESHAVSAVVVGGAAAGNGEASFSGGTP